MPAKTLPLSKKRRRRRKPRLVPAGSVYVKIYGRKGPFTVTWRESAGGPRRRTMRATLEGAKRLAEKIATDLANGQTAMLAFTEADRASWLTVCQNFARAGVSPEAGSARFADLVAQLQDVPPETAVKFFVENRPREFDPLPMAQLVKLFLADKEGQISTDWYNHLEHNLGTLSAFYSGPLHSLQAADINQWLASLKSSTGTPLGARARHNYRASLESLVNWSYGHGRLHRAWAELSHVPDPGQRAGDIRTLTPDQMTRLILARETAENTGRAHKTLIPFLAVQAWAGVRHAEATRLQWADVHLPERYIYIDKKISKGDDNTRRDRVIPISDNLAEWLAPYVKRSGPICPLVQIGGALAKAKRAAGIPAGDNETRNVLRKSFITYRKALTQNIAQVAEESGNSPAMIRKHYGRPIPQAEAYAWFEIRPTPAAVIHLNTARV